MRIIFTTTLITAALLLSGVAQAKPTWIVARKHAQGTTLRLQQKMECIEQISQWLAAYKPVQEAADEKQKNILNHALARAQELASQGKCLQAIEELEKTFLVLKDVQRQWLDIELEDLERLFMGPSTVEQRAMLRAHIEDVNYYMKTDELTKAVQTAKNAEDLFDNPPALGRSQLRNARRDDATEGMQILYELAEPVVENDPQAQRLLERVNTRVQHDIYNVWKNAALEDEEQTEAYEQILNQADTDLSALLRGPELPTGLDKKSTR